MDSVGCGVDSGWVKGDIEILKGSKGKLSAHVVWNLFSETHLSSVQHKKRNLEKVLAGSFQKKKKKKLDMAVTVELKSMTKRQS